MGSNKDHFVKVYHFVFVYSSHYVVSWLLPLHLLDVIMLCQIHVNVDLKSRVSYKNNWNVPELVSCSYGFAGEQSHTWEAQVLVFGENPDGKQIGLALVVHKPSHVAIKLGIDAERLANLETQTRTLARVKLYRNKWGKTICLWEWARAVLMASRDFVLILNGGFNKI